MGTPVQLSEIAYIGKGVARHTASTADQQFLVLNIGKTLLLFDRFL
jgi:hypothetical protein